jgi:hypothetical protein
LPAAGTDCLIEAQVAPTNVRFDDVGGGQTVLVADLVVEVLNEHVVDAAGNADPHLRESRRLP